MLTFLTLLASNKFWKSDAEDEGSAFSDQTTYLYEMEVQQLQKLVILKG